MTPVAPRSKHESRPRISCRIIPAVALLLAMPAIPDAAGASCPPGGVSGGPVLVAQLAAVGQAENAVGTLIVRRADGRVDQLRGQGSLPLFEGDELKTQRGSKALVRLADGAQLALNEETTFVVRGRAERGAGVLRLFKLLVGELWMRTPGATAIEVETPAATAAIKGTEFNLRVLPDGKSILTVLEGSVQLRNESCSPCLVARAAQSVVERGRPCAGVVPADPKPVVGWIVGLVP